MLIAIGSWRFSFSFLIFFPSHLEKVSCYLSFFICDDDDVRSLIYHDRSVSGNSIADHFYYYGVVLGTEDIITASQNSSMLGFCRTSFS